MTRITYLQGQAIIWVAKQGRNGEAQFEVPGHVVKVTPKRIAIKVLRKDAKTCIRYVTPERILPAPAFPPEATIRPTPRGSRNAPNPRSTGS